MQDSFKRRRTSQANLSWFEFTSDFMKYGAESLSVCSYTKPQSLGAHSKATPILAMKAELKRAMRASEASFVGKIGIPSSRESLVMTSPYERPPSAQTLGEGEGRLNVTCDFECS